MIIVTGLRSGTSLIMQTLKLLGVPVVGFKFHDDFSHAELNPKGYYDLPISETWEGLNTNKHKGKAVKLGGYQLSKTHPKYVDKVIVCDRNKKATTSSILRLMKADYNISRIKPTVENAELAYNSNKYLIDEYIKAKTNIRIQYEDMIERSELAVYKICGFLSIKNDVTEAINNIEKRELCL